MVPIREVLVAFGETLVRFVDSEAAVSAYRMVLAEAGRSDVGQRFFEQGPQAGLNQMAALLGEAMARDELRPADPDVASLHLHGLLTSELFPRMFSATAKPMDKDAVAAVVKRAVEMFLTGYGTENPV